MKKILIANRGEIARRIIRTCKRLGIETVAVYTQKELSSPFVSEADFRYQLKENSGAAYLNAKDIIEIAKDSQAEAIHPGYGFLSESAEFAKQVKEAGLIFIGPSAKVIEALGDKVKARELAKTLNIPILSGYSGAKQDEKTLLKEAEKISFPLLIKASSGGGGRGIKLVEKKEDFSSLLSSSKRETEKYFSDCNFVLEQYLKNARHIEVQLAGDSQGNIIHLYERDCSLQRKRQKVIEEAPAYGLDNRIKEKLFACSLSLAQTLKLDNLITCEFLVSGSDFYFLEANCRLQVEHTVTEEITGLDLVELQILIAFKKIISLEQENICAKGHAIEARIYAENPENNFLPTGGRISEFFYPAPLRMEESLYLGEVIDGSFDAMLAKAISHGDSREEALCNLKDSLSKTRIFPLKNNISFLLRLLSIGDFSITAFDTLYLENNLEKLKFSADKTLSHALIGAFISGSFLGCEKIYCEDKHPQIECSISRLGEIFGNSIKIRLLEVSFKESEGLRLLVQIEKKEVEFFIRHRKCEVWHECEVEINGELYSSPIVLLSPANFYFDSLSLCVLGEEFSVSRCTKSSSRADQGNLLDNQVTSPLPGKVLSVLCKNGDTISAGDTLFVLESMKMEHSVNSTTAGRVSKVLVIEGQQVDKESPLLELSFAQL